MVTTPNSGAITRSWHIETFVGVPYSAGGAVFSSAHFTLVDEAYFLSGTGTVPAQRPMFASIVAHGQSLPNQGSIGSTIAATLAPQQFKAGLYQVGTVSGTVTVPEIPNGTIASATFWISGH